MIENHKSNLISHFMELKSRLIYVVLFFFVTFIVSYIYIEHIYGFLLAPLSQQWVSQDKHMIYTNLSEIFFSYLHLSCYVAWFLTLPFLLCQVYIFIAPGLYSNEKRSILPFLVISPILFLLGAIFVYYIIFPLAWKFFLSFESQSLYGLPMHLEAKVSEYLNLTITMIIAFGLAFQMPVLLVLLAKMGVIDSKSLAKQRRFAVVFIFILAAILTPPDAISQVGLAVPMLILYELSIIACKKIEKEKKNA
jgi:sec-independent protein translocase protein TatC